jgi:hypothetical protein
MNRIARAPLALLGTLAALLVGCRPDYSLGLTSDAHGADVQETRIEILVGNAIGVQPLEDGDPLDPEVLVELSSTSPEIAEVAETGDPAEFVVWGRAPGIADVEIRIDGEIENVVEVEVLAR